MVKVEAYSLSAKLNFLLPAEQEVLPVPTVEWHRIMARIRQCRDTTQRLESFAWFAFGAALSLAIVAWQFPGSVKFSEVVSNVEQLNWRAYATEWAAIAFAALLAVCGGISLYHARDKAKLQTEMSDLIVEDMELLENRHLPRLHQEQRGHR